MNETTFELRSVDSHIEVHKFRVGSVIIVTALVFILQVILPKYFPKTGMIDLPLLITVYFALSRRNPSTGLLTGMTIGILQDALSHTPIGLNGIAKTVVGYLASSIGARLDTEHPASRFLLVFFFFALNQGIIILIQRLLLAQYAPWFTLHLAIAAAVNAIIGTLLFIPLDRLRKS